MSGPKLPESEIPLFFRTWQALAHGCVREVLIVFNEDASFNRQGCTEDFLSDKLQFPPFPGQFFIPATRNVVLVDNTVPVYFRTETACPPPEVQYTVSPVSNGLIRPQSHPAWGWCVLHMGFLPTSPALLFRNNVAAARCAA